MKSAYLLAGIKFLRLVRLVYKNNFAIRRKYIFRLLFLLQNSIWASIFSIVENITYRKKIRSFPLPERPVFILGHWRTGSTFLHQLMNLDPAFTAPSLFQVSIPDSFLVSGAYYKPIMKMVMSKHRPMDNVKLGFDEPQEDEYALFRMTNFSPLEDLIFPKKPGYFLKNCDSYLPNTTERDQWIDALKLFAKKLSFKSNGRQIVFKNPFHSMRIKTIKDIFPDAIFIYIYRDPRVVVPSTIRMWDIVGRQNCMNDNRKAPTTEEVVEVIDTMMTQLKKDVAELPQSNYAEIKFEDFEKSPILEIRKLYQKLELEFTTEFETSLSEFLTEIKDYKKNTYNLFQKDEEIIKNRLKHHLEFEEYFLNL